MRPRAFDPSRLFFPLIISVLLFTAYLPFRREPLVVPGFGDVRGYLQFAAYAALIFFVVRSLDALLFDVLVRRRRNVAAPQLLRGIVAIALYVLLFTSAFSTVF